MKILILNISCIIAFFSCNNTNVNNSVSLNTLKNDSLQVISKIDTIKSLIIPAKIGVINDTLKNSNATSKEEPIKIQPNDNFYVEGSSIRLRDSINYFIVMYNKTHLKFKNKGILNKKNVDSTIWENWQDLIIINVMYVAAYSLAMSAYIFDKWSRKSG